MPLMYQQEIAGAAAKFSLDPSLVAAVIAVESNFRTWAWNPEPAYRYLWDVRTWAPFRSLSALEDTSERPPTDFAALSGDPDQEFWAQQASWGLMQVMGAVAREHGCREPYLSVLCDPVVGLHYACKHLSAQLVWARGNVTQALAAYNGGRGGNAAPPYRNAHYASKVLAKFDGGTTA